jgi:hypothetical protein
MAATDEELLDGVVFRLAKVGPRFPPDSRKPLSAHFEFSSADKQEAEARGKWWLSVWDIHRSSPAQARVQLASSGGAYLPFGLEVARIRAIKAADAADVALRVFRDPLPPPPFPGSDGHCGLDGLHQHKRLARFLRSSLADAAFPWE